MSTGFDLMFVKRLFKKDVLKRCNEILLFFNLFLCILNNNNYYSSDFDGQQHYQIYIVGYID